MAKIKVLVVDDSAVVRQVVSEILNSTPDIEVVATAEDPFVAREKIKQLNPDVLTLDVEMPRMDGVTFLRNLMRLRPMPVVMLSTLTTEGADVTLEALELGAVDFIAKPRHDPQDGLRSFAGELQEKVRAAAGSRASLQRIRAMRRSEHARLRNDSGRVAPARLIAIGASTGGTEAIRNLLVQLPPNVPPIVVTQHIPPAFSERFACRLDSACDLTVCEAQQGQRLQRGHVYIAPGGCHLEIKLDSAGYRCHLKDSEPVNRHKPAVDVMFHSLVALGAQNVTAVLLTGMGSDGANGMLSLRQGGAHTIAQDQATSLIWGMPGSAVRLGAVAQVLPLGQIARAVLQHAVKD